MAELAASAGSERMTAAEAVPLRGGELSEAGTRDAAELLVLQRCCWVSEAVLNGTLEIPALHEDLDAVRAWVAARQVWIVRRAGRLVAAVRAHLEGDHWEIGRLMVAPDLAGGGLGRWLLGYAERRAPPEAVCFALFTGRASERNLRMYRRAGYVVTEPPASAAAHHISDAVHLTKPTGWRQSR